MYGVCAGGETWRDSVRLRSAGDQPSQHIKVDANKILQGPDPSNFSRPEPVKSGFELAAEMISASAKKANRLVRVHGQVAMRVEDTGAWVGVDGATIYFMQRRDILDDIELGSDVTLVNGDFDFDVIIDGIQDVYIKVRALNSRANIGTDAGFQTYGRNILETSDFSGTEFSA